MVHVVKLSLSFRTITALTDRLTTSQRLDETCFTRILFTKFFEQFETYLLFLLDCTPIVTFSFSLFLSSIC